MATARCLSGCWAEGHPFAFPAAKVYKRLRHCTEREWDAAKEGVRLGLGYREYMDIGKKYGAVLAVPIKIDRNGEVLGVVCLDVLEDVDVNTPTIIRHVVHAAGLIARRMQQ